MNVADAFMGIFGLERVKEGEMSDDRVPVAAPKPWVIDRLLQEKRDLVDLVAMHVADLAALRAKNKALEAKVEELQVIIDMAHFEGGM